MRSDAQLFQHTDSGFPSAAIHACSEAQPTHGCLESQTGDCASCQDFKSYSQPRMRGRQVTLSAAGARQHSFHSLGPLNELHQYMVDP